MDDPCTGRATAVESGGRADLNPGCDDAGSGCSSRNTCCSRCHRFNVAANYGGGLFHRLLSRIHEFRNTIFG